VVGGRETALKCPGRPSSSLPTKKGVFQTKEEKSEGEQHQGRESPRAIREKGGQDYPGNVGRRDTRIGRRGLSIRKKQLGNEKERKINEGSRVLDLRGFTEN